MLTALVSPKSEAPQNFKAHLQDGLETAGDLNARVGYAVAQAKKKSIIGTMNHEVLDAEKPIEHIFECIKYHVEPFEKIAYAKDKALSVRNTKGEN